MGFASARRLLDESRHHTSAHYPRGLACALQGQQCRAWFRRQFSLHGAAQITRSRFDMGDSPIGINVETGVLTMQDCNLTGIKGHAYLEDTDRNYLGSKEILGSIPRR